MADRDGMAERKQSKRGAKPKGNGLSSPSRKLYDKVAVKDPVRQGFYREVAEILRVARAQAHRAANLLMVEAYWNVGRKIVEEEQSGKKRAAYGEFLIERLSAKLGEELGHGFDVTNLKRMRQFYVLFPKGATAWHLLSWSHFSNKYSVLSESKQLFASQYRLVLPTEEELRREIERERDLAVREQEARYG